MRIILGGYGNVGRSLHRLLDERDHELLSRYSMTARIVAVVDRKGAAVNGRGLDHRMLLEAKDRTGSVSGLPEFGRPDMSVKDVIEEVEADVYVDTTTANFTDGQPSLSYMEAAIARRLHVITSNKAPLALAMPALLELAEYRGVKLLYSGTVGGGTPFLSFASNSLRGNKILGVRGVLNGTTNYIMYRMEKDGMCMREALEEARKLGYAEADPILDISGIDPAAKLVILVNHTTGSRYTIRDVKIDGVEGLKPGDFEVALEEGKTLKLLSNSIGGLEVHVEEVDVESPLNVPSNLNAVEFLVEELGSVYLIGRGAGGIETAAAILRDIVGLSS